MKILVLCSREHDVGRTPENEYTQRCDTAFAQRVLGNLRNDGEFCTACGNDCVDCRRPYGRDFGQDIAGVLTFSALLPYLLENPRDFLPPEIPRHDVLLAICIHEQILLEMLKICASAGTKAVVVPLEASAWITPAAREQAEAICARNRIEIAFPKPFCRFDPAPGTVLDRFRRHFHIGAPEVRLEWDGDRISETHVEVSAACGATYYVARWLKGKTRDDDLRHDVVSRRFHSYPCTASMQHDDELGDSPLHVSGQAHYKILADKDEPDAPSPETESTRVLTPLGIVLPKAVPIFENEAKVAKAIAFVLDEIAGGASVPVSQLRQRRNVTPAALNTALLVLKQEGTITIAGTAVRRACARA